MSDPAAEGRDLARELDELRTLYNDLRNATTPAEKEEVREEIAEQREDLDALAKSLGLSPAALQKATAAARREEEREKLRPIVDELIEARLAQLADEDDDDEEPAPEPVKAPSPPKQERAPKEPDTEPVAEHWSDRPITGLLKR